jgi:hypothetical protein
MAIKNVYEVFDAFKAAKTKQERLDILQKNKNFAVMSVLQGAFSPDVKFSIKKIPEYKSEDVPPGMSYNHINDALSRTYLFVEGHPRCPPALTDSRKNELLIQILESLEPKEAEVFVSMIKKDLKISYLTPALINEAFPGLLPE